MELWSRQAEVTNANRLRLALAWRQQESGTDSILRYMRLAMVCSASRSLVGFGLCPD
jgi:hypothetical protein